MNPIATFLKSRFNLRKVESSFLKSGAGFTFIEIVIVLAILLILFAITVGSFSQFNKSVTLGRDAEKIISMLNQARTNTIASKGGIQYGVHFESAKAVIFSGAVYNPNALDNDPFYLKTFESLSSISLEGGGSEIVFSRVTGTTPNFGSVTLSIVGDGQTAKVISVSFNGMASLQ